MFPIDVHFLGVRRPSTMPGWLQPIAEHNPFTVVTSAVRALYSGMDPGKDLLDLDRLGRRHRRRVRSVVVPAFSSASRWAAPNL